MKGSAKSLPDELSSERWLNFDDSFVTFIADLLCHVVASLLQLFDRVELIGIALRRSLSRVYFASEGNHNANEHEVKGSTKSLADELSSERWLNFDDSFVMFITDLFCHVVASLLQLFDRF